MSRWDLLLDVQQFDTQADQLRHRAKHLPAREQIVRIDQAIEALDHHLAELDVRKGELTRSQKRLEDEVAALGERANQAEKQLYSGTITNPRELQALQDDIASIRRRIHQIEDDELEIMELTEPVDADRADLISQRTELEGDAARLRAELADAEREINADLARVEAERAAAAANVPDELWPEYDQLRRTHGGVAIARLAGTTCQGCHLGLSAVEIDRIRKLGLDEPVHCEECGRLLVRS